MKPLPRPRAGATLWLYRVLLTGLLPAAAPALWLSARLKGKSRPPLGLRLAPDVTGVRPGGLWLQAVSVGEVEVARRLLAELERCAPELPVLLTSTTATGLALARRTVGDRVPVLACPLDLPWSVSRVLDTARPRALVLVETELWPEMLHQAARRAIPVAVANGRLSEGAFARYLRVRGPLRRLLDPLALVLARGEVDAARFAAIGVSESRIRVVGNIKYDLEPSREPLPWEDLARGWAGQRPIVVAGSTVEGEEASVLAAAAALGGFAKAFLVLAPRHPERFPAVARLLTERAVAWTSRSRLGEAPASPDVLLLDTIGELSRAYRLGVVAFVGGSLGGRGGHNPLEPAVWAVPVLSGPHVESFREIYDQLLAAGGALAVHDPSELAGALGAWLADPAARQAAGRAAARVVEANRGATARTVTALLTLAGWGDGAAPP
jgi:3-deoxy-D-manno-octulosonic-acid transferase